MNLFVISHTAHYQRNGVIVGWGPTVKEISWLAKTFDQVTHLAYFHPVQAPGSAIEYKASNINCIFVPPSGGLNLRLKSRVITNAPGYLHKIISNIGNADVVHVRCPSSIGNYGLPVTSLARRGYSWVKYAGNWNAARKEAAISQRFQRWWLNAGLYRGPVTINGKWPDQKANIKSFLNPSFSLSEAEAAREGVTTKHLEDTVRIVFIGRTSNAKGFDVALEVIRLLRAELGPNIRFDVIGSPEDDPIKIKTETMGIKDVVRYHGWKPYNEVFGFLKAAHFILLPSRSEGWPKVLSEAMAFGAVQLASDISAIPQILNRTNSGFALPLNNPKAFANTILNLVNEPDTWKTHSLAGISLAPQFTYERYLVELDNLFKYTYGDSPMNQDVIQDLRSQLRSINSEGIVDLWRQ